MLVMVGVARSTPYHTNIIFFFSTYYYYSYSFIKENFVKPQSNIIKKNLREVDTME